MAGAGLPAVQRILRHSDPRLTMGTYGHLTPNYLRSEINRLPGAPPPPEQEPSSAVAVAASGGDLSPLVTPLVQGPSDDLSAPPKAADELEGFPAFGLERDIGFEPTTFSLGS